MRSLPLLRLLVFASLFPNAAFPQSDGSCNLNPAVDGTPNVPTQTFDQLKTRYASSVFRVYVGQEFNGNAVLISPAGYFLTAAHVVPGTSESKVIRLQRQIPSGYSGTHELNFDARVVFRGTPSTSPADTLNDIALLYAPEWSKKVDDQLSPPVPLRYTGPYFSSGFFLAFPDEQTELKRYPADSAGLERTSPEGSLVGAAISGRSGAPLFDAYGYLEGVVASYNNLAGRQAAAAAAASGASDDERAYLYTDYRSNFGAAGILPGANWLQQIPASDSRITQISARCKSQAFSRNDLDFLNAPGAEPLSLYDLDRLFVACSGPTTANTHLNQQLRWLLAELMRHRCAEQDVYLRILYAGIPAPKAKEIGDLALNTYLQQVAGPGHLKPDFTTVVSPSSPNSNDTSKLLRQAVDALSYAQLSGQDPSGATSLSLAKAEYETGLASGTLLRANDPAVVSIVSNLARAQNQGASSVQVAAIATNLSEHSSDWDSAAALAAKQFDDLKRTNRLDAQAAKQLDAQITSFATNKKQANESSKWVVDWTQTSSANLSPTERLSSFASADAPLPKGSFTQLFSLPPTQRSEVLAGTPSLADAPAPFTKISVVGPYTVPPTDTPCKDLSCARTQVVKVVLPAGAHVLQSQCFTTAAYPADTAARHLVDCGADQAWSLFSKPAIVSDHTSTTVSTTFFNRSHDRSRQIAFGVEYQ